MAIKILLTSESKIKVTALKEYFNTNPFFDNFIVGNNLNIQTLDCSDCDLPAQPYGDINTILSFAKERLNFSKTKCDSRSFDFIISIESGICENKDYCTILISHKDILASSYSFGLLIKTCYIDKLKANMLINFNKKISGYSITAGDIMHNENNTIDTKNWMLQMNGVDRKHQIIHALGDAFKNLDIMLDTKKFILSEYKLYQDYPKPGIIFQDVFSILKNKNTLKKTINLLTDKYKYDDLDYVVGLESRGFCLGTLLAFELGVGFIPIRKEAKLPGNTTKISYLKEYGKDVCEIQTDIAPNSRILIIDDLIATGGSMQAAINLVVSLNLIIVDCCVLREVLTLREQCLETISLPYSVLFQD